MTNSSTHTQQDLIIAGVGGQGILTISGVIGMAAPCRVCSSPHG